MVILKKFKTNTKLGVFPYCGTEACTLVIKEIRLWCDLLQSKD
jgi:hypothetical protein